MKKRHRLTYDEVASVADTLKSIGKMPSLQDVCEGLQQDRITMHLVSLYESWRHDHLSLIEDQMFYLNQLIEVTDDLLPMQYGYFVKMLVLIKQYLAFILYADDEAQYDFNQHQIKLKCFDPLIAQLTQKARVLCLYDEMTDLPNRDFLMKVAKYYIKQHAQVAFVCIDLDYFRIINHTFGHETGNMVLKTVANRLRFALQAGELVARYGEDKFMLLLPAIAHIKTWTQNIRHLLTLPIKNHSDSIRLSASLGISLYPKDGVEHEVLLNRAEFSMYDAKQHGRNTVRFFSNVVHHEVTQHAKMRDALANALKRKELSLVYQPMINVKSHRVEGVEALLRWQSPHYGHISPQVFIPLAESSGLILKIGAWVIETACVQTMRWHQMGFHHLSVAVNLSEQQLHQSNLPHMVAKILDKTGLPPSFLELELTENSFVVMDDGVMRVMQQLKALGVKLAIDDFGIGYSCLSYLNYFPVDKELIANLVYDQKFIRRPFCPIVQQPVPHLQI